MHLHYLPVINAKDVVLASGSPRRKDALDMMGVKYRVVVSRFPEDLEKERYTPDEYVGANARQKGLEVFERLQVCLLLGVLCFMLYALCFVFCVLCFISVYGLHMVFCVSCLCFVFYAVFACAVVSALLLLLLCGRLTFIPPTVRGRCARLGDQRGHGRGAPRAHPREARDARERGGGVSARHPVLACVALAALSCRCYLSLHALSLHALSLHALSFLVFSFLVFSVEVFSFHLLSLHIFSVGVFSFHLLSFLVFSADAFVPSHFLCWCLSIDGSPFALAHSSLHSLARFLLVCAPVHVSLHLSWS